MKNAIDFNNLAKVSSSNEYYQADNIQTGKGIPIEYLGSTSGPWFNQAASPLQVSWSVRREVVVVDINSVKGWYNNNIFAEDPAHGVLKLGTKP
ncbi:MAG: hypothetical protein ACI854_001743 [Arenicella sp.]|jgi:hypothetical protein